MERREGRGVKDNFRADLYYWYMDEKFVAHKRYRNWQKKKKHGKKTHCRAPFAMPLQRQHHHRRPCPSRCCHSPWRVPFPLRAAPSSPFSARACWTLSSRSLTKSTRTTSTLTTTTAQLHVGAVADNDRVDSAAGVGCCRGLRKQGQRNSCRVKKRHWCH